MRISGIGIANICLLIFAILFVFTPIGIGWNPFKGEPVITTTSYHNEPMILYERTFYPSEGKYQIRTIDNVIYSTNKEVYNQTSVGKRYLMKLQTTTSKLNMGGYFIINIPEKDKVISSTVISEVVEEICMEE